MTELFASVNGARTQRMGLWVPNGGPWFADAILDEATELSGAVTISLGSLALRGTVDPSASGSFGAARSVRVVGGANGWGKLVKPKDYHVQGGVPALLVAQDAAREVGETLGTFEPAKARLGGDYVRESGAAATVLERALGGRPWWVDYDGLSHGGNRPAAEVAGEYSLLNFEPRTRLAVLSVEEPAVIQIGSILRDRLSQPQTVRELHFAVEKTTFRVHAWCGGSATSTSRLGDALGAIVQGFGRARLDGIYRYRVATMDGAAANLQAVSKAAGLPHLMKVTQAMAGATWVDLAPGAIVYVQFVAGDRTDPRITGVDAELGAGATRGVARQNDATLTYLPTKPIAVALGPVTLAGTPSTTLQFLAGTGMGPLGVPPGLPGGHLPGNVVTASKRFRVEKT